MPERFGWTVKAKRCILSTAIGALCLEVYLPHIVVGNGKPLACVLGVCTPGSSLFYSLAFTIILTDCTPPCLPTMSSVSFHDKQHSNQEQPAFLLSFLPSECTSLYQHYITHHHHLHSTCINAIAPKPDSHQALIQYHVRNRG
jgi:hypothetical protein